MCIILALLLDFNELQPYAAYVLQSAPRVSEKNLLADTP